jgi:hypothetical protein
MAGAARASVERAVRRVSIAVPRRSDESGAPIDHGGNLHFFGTRGGTDQIRKAERKSATTLSFVIQEVV